MLQQVNLYKLLPQKKEFFLTKKVVLASYGSFIFLLALFYIAGLWQKHKLNNQFDELTKKVALSQQNLTLLTQAYPVTDIETLRKNLQRLEAEYSQKAIIIDLLSPYAHFSKYLVGLGNAIVPGVWLTEINFNREEIKIALKGYTLQPSLIEQFFTQLTKEPIFSNLAFKVNEIKQEKFPASFYITAKGANRA